jgi:hypothetical protein
MRAVLRTMTIVWIACGAVALLTLADVVQTGTLGEVVLMWPAIALWTLGIHRVLTDAAHGPPFLTVGGILVLYLAPALIGYASTAVVKQRV